MSCIPYALRKNSTSQVYSYQVHSYLNGVQLWRLPLVLPYNIDTLEQKKAFFSSYITLTHTSAVFSHGQIIDDELSNQYMCFALGIKKNFDLENFAINHILHRNFLKHSSEVLEEPERHYKLMLSKRILRWASN